MSNKSMIVAVAALTAAFLVAGLLGPLDFSKDARDSTRGDDAVSSVLAPTAGTDAARQVRALERQVRSGSKDPKAYSSLALFYLQQARTTADPSLLPEAEELLERSLSLDDEENFEANVGMASLSNARHDFTGSVRWARAAIDLNPHNASPYGLLGDALFELGRYEAAEQTYQTMIDLRPNLASYVRASYALQFRGDSGKAIRAMRLALQSAGPVGESPAWIRHQLADIYLGLGKLKAAAKNNYVGTQLAPEYVPPQVGLAEVAIAKGRLHQAISIVKTAAERLPSLEYLIKLGDLYRATGRSRAAAEQYRAAADRLRSYRAGGVLPDVDFILFYADHSLRPRRALHEARFVYRNRPTAAAADALAWLLQRQGSPRRAWTYTRRAVHSPSANGSFYFHAGVIARELGMEPRAERYLRRAIEQETSLSILQLRQTKKLLGTERARFREGRALSA